MYKYIIYITLVTCLALSACTKNTPLNSERIRAQFGNYQLEVLYADSTLRISDLFTLDNDIRTTRTLALVHFADDLPPALRDAHLQVLNGGSIGETLKGNGWTINKQHLQACTLEPEPQLNAWLTGMRLDQPRELAVHSYLLSVSRDGVTADYTQIIEIHHPAYLDIDGLKSIYNFPDRTTDLACRHLATRLPTPAEHVRDR